jgi:hypothetical protein
MSIDYGRGTLANRNPETGIRYGVYQLNNLPSWVWDTLEGHYTSSCPNCGTECGESDLVIPADLDSDDLESFAEDLGREDLADLANDDASYCPHCHSIIESPDDMFPMDADYHELDSEGVKGITDRDCTILWVTESPHIGSGSHCSPCVPGAVNEPRIGAKGDAQAYCLPDSWFDSED